MKTDTLKKQLAVINRAKTHKQTANPTKIVTLPKHKLLAVLLYATTNIGYAANLIVNGSFEAPSINGAAGGYFFTSITGWTGVGDQIEIGNPSTFGVNGATNAQVVELDSNVRGVNTGFYQMVATAAQQNYLLSVDVAARSGTSLASNTVEVWWRGARIATIDPASTTFTNHTFEVQGSGGSDRLEFREQAGDDDGLGGMIDNVRLEIPGALPNGNFKAVLRAVHSGLCLTNQNSSTANSNPMQQNQCNGTPAQELNFKPVVGNPDTYTLVVGVSNKCLDVGAKLVTTTTTTWGWGGFLGLFWVPTTRTTSSYANSTADGAAINQYQCNGSLSQQFKLLDKGNGSYNLQAQHSGKMIDAYGASIASGGGIVQWSANEANNQKWYLEFDSPTSLKGVSPPKVPGLLTSDSSRSDIITPVVVNKSEAIKLGKALFWDQAIGSDGMSCASCHFHAGVDFRIKNMVNPGFTHSNFTFEPTASGAPRSGPNYTLKKADFPFNPSNDDSVSSSGVFDRTFSSFSSGNNDTCTTNANNDFNNVGSVPVRLVEPRNTPTTINAAYNFRNFWDGRANNVFNGVSPFGLRDKSAGVFINSGGIVKRPLNLINSSLASQAVGPVLSTLEMSCAQREFAGVGRKVLARKPLANQTIHSQDSVLASLIASNTTYANLVQSAFNPAYWNASCTTCGTPAQGGAAYTQMEANFPMFFGLAVQLYEATLVSDDTKFDKWKEGSLSLTSEEQLGHDVFDGKGECSTCHKGPVLTSAANLTNNTQLIERMGMKNIPTALYDIGFYNLGVVPTNYDIGLGGTDPWNNPLSFSAQYKSGIFVDKFNTNSCRFEVPYSVLSCSDSSLKSNDPLAVAGSFKTPTLRNIALTGPYMHNGSLSTLEQVVDFYNLGGNFNNLEKHPDIKPLGLSATEKSALVAFLKTLTDNRVAYEKAPFDHPSLTIPNGHVGNDWSVSPGNNINPTLAQDEVLNIPAVGSAGLPTPVKTFYDILP